MCESGVTLPVTSVLSGAFRDRTYMWFQSISQKAEKQEWKGRREARKTLVSVE